MNKSKEKQFNFLSKRQNRYAIRRFSAGIASVLVGTALFFGVHTSEASAAEQDQTSETKQTPPDVSDTGDTLTETNEKAAQVPTTATHPSTEEVKQKATDLNAPSEQSPQTVEQSNEAQPTEIPTNDAASTPEAPVKEQPNDAQATDESNNVTPKNDTEQQANNETSTRNTKTTDEMTTEETKTETSIKEKVTEENAAEKTPQEDTPHSEAVPKNETDTTEKQATESSTSKTSTTETSTTDTATQKQESRYLEKPTAQTQMKTTQSQTTETPKLTEEELEDLLTETSFESMDATTRALYLDLIKDYTNKQDALKPAATVKTRNQPDKVTAPKTKAWPSDVVPESEVEIPADAIANGYVGSATDATNAAHTLSGRAWVLGHGTPATMANGLKPVPEGTKVHLQWIDTDGATSPIYTAKTTNRLSPVDGSQVGPGAYAFDLRQGWTDANGKHHLYSATKGQRYKLWIDDFRTKDGNINTMLRVSGGFIPGTFADSVTHNNMGQFPLVGTNMQRTGIFMTTIPGEEYLTAKHVVNDSKGATANPAVTMIEDNYVSGKLWVETGYGDYSNSATGPNFNSKDKAAAGYKVVMTSLTDTGAKAYDAHVNHLPEKDRAAAAHKLLTAHPEYMSVTVVGTTNERGEYTLRFPKGTLNKDHLYGYVLNPDGDIVTSYSGFTSPEFRRPNYDLATAPQTAPYYRPIRNAWANVNFAVMEATHAQINIKNFDATSNPGHRGQAAYVDITGMPHTSLPTRVQWKDSTGKVVQNSGPVTSEAEAERKGQFTIPTDAKSGDVYTVELVVGDSVTASDSLIVHVNEDAAKYQPVYPAVTVEPGQSVTIPAPKNADGKALPNGTTFEKGYHVPTWVTVNGDGSIIVKPGKHVTEDDYGIPVIVTYPDGSRNTIFAPVTVQEKEPMASEYEPTTEGVTKPFGTPVTSDDVTSSIHIPNFPAEGQQPTATVDDETQLPDGTTEGRVDVGVTVTYPDGTTDHITVPVVTNKQPDGDKYEPTSEGVTKPFGTPVTSADVTSSIHIPNFPVEGQQPTATVDDETQLPDGTTEGQVDVGVTVTYPDGTTDHITVPVVTQNQPDGDKYEPTSEGVTKPFGTPVTSADVTSSIHIPNFPGEGQQPTATVDDETQLPDGTTEGRVDVGVTVTYPDGTTDHITVPVVTNKQPDGDKYEPTSEGVTKPFGTPVTSDDVTDSIHIPNFPGEGQQPTATVDDESQLPDGTVEGQVDVGVTVTYPDGTTDHITVPVVTQKQPDGDKYDPTTTGVTKPFGEPVTSTDVTDSVKIPNFPVEGQQPTATVDDETQLPDGTTEGQVDVGVTVTYPDGTTDHITVPVVTQNQPDNEKYEPTTTGITKVYGTPTTAAEVTGSVRIPHFPVDGKQPVVTVNDPRQLPNGKKEGQINVPVTVTYPDGTKDHMTVPVITGKQADNEKYDPITLGVVKNYGDPTTAADVTDSIQIPTYPVGGQQPVATVDDETQLPDGTTEGEVDIPVTVTYPDGTQDHITVPVFTNQQQDNQKYEPTSEGVTKDYGIPTGVDDVLNTVTVPDYPADREEQPVKTVDAPDRLPDGTTEGQVLVGVTVTYPDGSKDHIKVPVVTNPPTDNVRYEPTTDGITKPFGEPTTADDVTSAVKIPNFPTEGDQPIVTVINPKQLPNGKKEGQTNVGVTVTYPDGTTDYFTVPVVTTQQSDSDKYTPTTEGITKPFGVPTNADEVEDAVHIPGYPTDAEAPVVTVKDVMQLPDGSVGATVDVDVIVTYPDGTTDEISVPVTTESSDDEGGHGSSGSSAGGSAPGSNGPTVRPSIKLTGLKGFVSHFAGPTVNHQQADSDKYSPTSEGVTKAHGTPVTTTDVTGSVHDSDGSTTEVTVPVPSGSAPTIHLETADSNDVKSTLTTVDAVDTQTENVSTTKNDTPTADDVPTVAQGHETEASATKDQQQVGDKVITMPTVAHGSKQTNHDEKASNQTNDTTEKVTSVTTTAASVANGNVVPTHLATAPHAQVTQPVGNSAETTAKEEVKQLPETGENKKQASALLGGLIAVIGGLLIFGRRRNEKKD
ncbi:Rib/alpha-like domain-containing protein [Staphylococcus delphini]|uniref:Rib/alpha-like domain-containing protein n=1 Tax=Staphylococcus delphini TaxID=53344 RepID=UPI0029341DAF|nr:Rib/alpha-like domain-containing protein [Staphylococcus delphini]